MTTMMTKAPAPTPAPTRAPAPAPPGELTLEFPRHIVDLQRLVGTQVDGIAGLHTKTAIGAYVLGKLASS
jgi:hypothetical protein